MKRLFFSIICISIGSQLGAQSLWSAGLNPYYGAVFKYKDNMDQLEFTNLHGIELYAAKEADGSKEWHQYFNYPQWGVAGSYFNYGVPDELGEVVSLTTYLDFTAGKKKHKWRLNIGTGLVYSTVKFEPITNEENTAISSDISYVLRGTIHKEFQLSDHYFFNLNFAFRHFSNGRLNMPNNGMNYPIIGVGLRYLPNTYERKEPQNSRIIDPKLRYAIRGSMSWRQVLEIDEPHKAYSVSAYASKQITKINTLLFGLDFFKYDRQSVQFQWNVYNAKNGIEPFRVSEDQTRQMAITLGTELLINQFSVVVQGGFYVYKPQDFYSSWYQRYGLKYNLHKHAFTQVSLKSHSRTADLVEFGIGLML